MIGFGSHHVVRCQAEEIVMEKCSLETVAVKAYSFSHVNTDELWFN